MHQVLRVQKVLLVCLGHLANLGNLDPKATPENVDTLAQLDHLVFGAVKVTSALVVKTVLLVLKVHLVSRVPLVTMVKREVSEVLVCLAMLVPLENLVDLVRLKLLEAGHIYLVKSLLLSLIFLFNSIEGLKMDPGL